MKIDLLTLYYPNYSSLGDCVLSNWIEYCNKHGYGLNAYIGHYGFDASIPLGFHKTKFVYDQLFNNPDAPDAALVLDLDIMITNMEIQVGAFLGGHPNANMILTADVNGVNSGSYVIRRNDGAKQLLEYMLGDISNFTCEQNTIKERPDNQIVKDNVEVLEHPSINSYLYESYPEFSHHAATNPGQWKPGHFLLHLPGMSLERRLGIFQSEKIQSAIIR